MNSIRMVVILFLFLVVDLPSQETPQRQRGGFQARTPGSPSQYPVSPRSGEVISNQGLLTEILGQSQTLQWFPKFRLQGWQARIQTGSGYMHWKNEDHTIWKNPILPGVSGPVPASSIERVVITIGKSPQEKNGGEGSYESLLSDLILLVRKKYPALKEIRLQPLAAGPDRMLCDCEGETVATTKNLAAIEAAMSVLTARYPDVKKGLIPLAGDCTAFKDKTGHLTREGIDEFARKNEDFYRDI